MANEPARATVQTNPVRAFIQAAINLGTVTSYQSSQAEQNPDVTTGRKAPFDLWIEQGIAAPTALPTVLHASLLLLAQDQAYANQYRGDLVLASILLDQEKLTPRAIHQALCRLHFARAQGMNYALDEFLAKQGLIPLETSRHLLVSSTFPTWLPIARRSRTAIATPPVGVQERRKATRRASQRLAIAKQRRSSPVGAVIGIVGSVVIIVGTVLWANKTEPRPRVQDEPEIIMPVVHKPVKRPDPLEDAPVLIEPTAPVSLIEPTVPIPTKAIPQDLIDCPAKIRVLIDESRTANRDAKLAEARRLLEAALARLEHDESKEGGELRGECQALLQLVLKLSR